MLPLLALLLGFPRRSDIPEYDVADLPALREIDIDALLPQIPDADPLFQAALRKNRVPPPRPAAGQRRLTSSGQASEKYLKHFSMH